MPSSPSATDSHRKPPWGHWCGLHRLTCLCAVPLLAEGMRSHKEQVLAPTSWLPGEMELIKGGSA